MRPARRGVSKVVILVPIGGLDEVAAEDRSKVT